MPETTLDQIIADAPAAAPQSAPAPQPAPAGDPPITVGRIVHYHEYTDTACESIAHRAAIVTAAWGPECCNLLVIGERGDCYPRTSVMRSSGYGVGGAWSYPPRA